MALYYVSQGNPPMKVSWNGSTPKSSILIICIIINHPFWVPPHLWKPLNELTRGSTFSNSSGQVKTAEQMPMHARFLNEKTALGGGLLPIPLQIVRSGTSRVNPLTTLYNWGSNVLTYLVSGMNHQVTIVSGLSLDIALEALSLTVPFFGSRCKPLYSWMSLPTASHS